MTYEYTEGYKTKTRGHLEDEYEIYRNCANNGKGGDVTRNGAPLKTFEEWLNHEAKKSIAAYRKGKQNEN